MLLNEQIRFAGSLIGYNLKIIFSGKFLYFLIAAWIFYLVIIFTMLFSGTAVENNDVYDLLLFPGMLIMFYPVVYNIQNDKDNRTLEIIFGVPDYRYKVYLLRFCIVIILLFIFLLLMAAFAWFSIYKIPVFPMVIHLMSPLIFMACLTFMLSTLLRNGNGAAVVMIIIGLIFFLLNEAIVKSKWNLFLNPFNIPADMNIAVWLNIVHQNRLIMAIGSLIALLWSLMNLQKREKFV